MRRVAVSDSFDPEWIVGGWKILPLRRRDDAVVAVSFTGGGDIALENQGDLLELSIQDMERFFFPVLKMGNGSHRADPSQPRKPKSYFEEI